MNVPRPSDGTMIAGSGKPGARLANSDDPDPSSAAVELIEWLVGDECHNLDDVGLAAGLGQRLHAAGLPIDGLTLHLRTLHPEIFGRSVLWAPGEAVEVRSRGHGIEASPGFAGSPLRRVMESGEPLVVRLDGSADPPWVHTDLFQGRDLVEFAIVPLRNAGGLVSAASFSTRRRSGFAQSEQAVLSRIVPALRNACELLTLRRGHSLLMSERFAKLLGPGTAVAIGRYKLTGFSEPAELHALADRLVGHDEGSGS